MKQATIDRIRNSREVIVIGKYSYSFNERGEIIRCKTEDIGRTWIDDNGHQYDAWEVVL